MGAWGVGPFDNDDALDVVEAISVRGDEVLDDVFLSALDNEYMEAPAGSAAVAASRLLLAKLVGESFDEPSVMRALAKISSRAANLNIPKAIEATTAVLKEKSELFELWSDAGEQDFAEWKRQTTRIVDRLTNLGQE